MRIRHKQEIINLVTNSPQICTMMTFWWTNSSTSPFAVPIALLMKTLCDSLTLGYYVWPARGSRSLGWGQPVGMKTLAITINSGSTMVEP
jgi:hypothetical protein